MRDEKGEYKDFRNHVVYWRNEWQMAHAMVDG